MNVQQDTQDQAERERIERAEAAAAAYLREKTEKLAVLIRWRDADPWWESVALHELADRLRGLEVSDAGYDHDDAVMADEALEDIIDWAYRQQNRLTGGSADQEPAS